MVEEFQYIELGKRRFDISNISVKKRRFATRMWNQLLGIKTDEDGEAVRDSKGNIEKIEKKDITEKEATREILKIGVFLVRQNMKVLLRRYTLIEAVKEYAKRLFLSISYLESLTREELNNFVSWIYEELTGQKKKTMDFLTPIIEQMEAMTKDMTESELLEYQTYLLTSLSEQVGRFQKLKASHKKK